MGGTFVLILLVVSKAYSPVAMIGRFQALSLSSTHRLHPRQEALKLFCSLHVFFLVEDTCIERDGKITMRRSFRAEISIYLGGSPERARCVFPSVFPSMPLAY